MTAASVRVCEGMSEVYRKSADVVVGLMGRESYQTCLELVLGLYKGSGFFSSILCTV